LADNPSRKFKFISPGVFIDEIDNSQLPASPADTGPVVIGRSFKGPGMTPVTITSFSDFVDTFGEPLPGGQGGDTWREGNKTAPTYGAYAAQAWLRNNPTLTYVRLLGEQHPDLTSDSGEAGFKIGAMDATSLTDLTKGGAWGLYVWPSASAGSNDGGPATTGSLAAIMYLKDGGGRVQLSGSMIDPVDGSTPHPTGSSCLLIPSNSDGTLVIQNITAGGVGPSSGTKYRVSLDPSRPDFIRKVVNVNPTTLNDNITSTSGQQNLFVGESFERALTISGSNSIGTLGTSGATSGNGLGNSYWAAIMPMRNISDHSDQQNDMRLASQKATTGWFFAQDTSTLPGAYDVSNMQKLFRLEARTGGEWVQNEVKISVANITAPQGAFEEYGTFSVLVRRLKDQDNAPAILERWDNLSLNPASPNYIAKQIGDQYESYDTITKTNRQYGQYSNRSKYIRVVMDDSVERGTTNAVFLPFGVFGPLKYRDWGWISGSGGFSDVTAHASASHTNLQTITDGGDTTRFAVGGGYQDTVFDNDANNILSIQSASNANDQLRLSCVYPSVPLRQLDTWGSPKTPKNVYWGAWTHRTDTDTTFNDSVPDMLRIRCKNLNPTDPANTSRDLALPLASGSLGGADPLEIAWAFSLDNVSGTFDTANNNAVVDGSGQYNAEYRTAGKSLTAQSQSVNGVSYQNVLDAGYDRFSTVLFGGFDGFDVTERDPFRNSGISATATEKTSYELATLKRAVNIIADADQVQYNLASIPGVTNQQATQHLLDTVEDRGDALAIIDIENVYLPDTENANTEAERNNFTITQAVTSLRDRNINTSYGATYAPWVLIQDTSNSRTLWAPPSVVALGALSTTDRDAAPWYAPAGFARGGLSEGAGGVPVLEVSRRLSSDDRDVLYDAGINPIAKFPAEGIVVFGQKTLQQTASALDRINVRRLMIFLKRRISFIASRLLFAPNTRDTWTRFTGQAIPVLDSVKAQFGIEDFRLILDESTTTPDLIDRNIIYSKLLVKPTRSAEFFAIDFVITNSGASFED
jgi:hypothetical protein